MSAFGYFGSKKRLARKIVKKLPPHHAWVELFCGSSAMTMAKKQAPIEIVNDINGDIVNFYRQLREHQHKLVRAIELTPYAREELELARAPVSRKRPVSKVEQARRFFVSAMMAINGAFGEKRGGFSYTNAYARLGTEARVSRWKKMPEHLIKVAKRFKNVRIERKDAMDLLKDFRRRPATLLYVDPPYLGERANGYENDANERAFHFKLLTELKKAKCMIFISGYENELYDQHLTKADGWTRQSFKAHTKSHNGKTHDRAEIVWMNEAFRRAQKTDEVPIELTRKEKKNNKLNPAR